MPFSKSEVADYEKKRYRGLDQRLVHNREQKILNKIFERIEKTSGFVLDLPCGYGRFSAILLEKGFKLVNSDISLAMVDRTKKKAATLLQREARGVVTDAVFGLPFKKDTFSLVLSMRFFHHVHSSEDRRKILAEFFRVTSDWVVLSYYQSNALHKIQRKLRQKIKKTPTRIKMIAGQEFQNEAKESGFEVVSVFPLFRGFHSQHITLLKKLKPERNARF